MPAFSCCFSRVPGAEAARPRAFSAGELIHNGDADCVGLLLVKSGRLRVFILSEDGREITLYRLLPGETP